MKRRTGPKPSSAPSMATPSLERPAARDAAEWRRSAASRTATHLRPRTTTQPVTPPNNPDTPSQDHQQRGPVDWEAPVQEPQRARRGRGQAQPRCHRTDERAAGTHPARERDPALRRGQSLPTWRRTASRRVCSPTRRSRTTALSSSTSCAAWRPRRPAPLNDEIMRLRSGLGHVQEETGNAFLTRMNATIGAASSRAGAKSTRTPSSSRGPGCLTSSAVLFGRCLCKRRGTPVTPVASPHFSKPTLQRWLPRTRQGGNGQHRPAPRTVVTDERSSLIPPASPTGLNLASHLAAPGRAHSAGGAPAEKPVYTAAEITRFYTDVAAGRWRGRDAQRTAIDADIIQAQREGRIIPDNRTQLPKDPYTR